MTKIEEIRADVKYTRAMRYKGYLTYEDLEILETKETLLAEIDRLTAENAELKQQLTDTQERLIDTIKKHCDDVCRYCENRIECKGKSCEKYINGIGDIEGKYPNVKWSCEDFDYGTCPLMEKSPCNGCIENDFRGFVLRGTEESK